MTDQAVGSRKRRAGASLTNIGRPVMGWMRAGLTALPAVRLDGARVCLRPPQSRDWKEWCQLREVSRDFLTPWEPTWASDSLTKAAFGRRLRRQITDWRQDQSYSFLIFDKGEGQLLGGIGVNNVRRGVAQIGSVGYWIGAPFARQGFMTDGLRTCVDFGFRHLGLHRIEAACLPTNAASKRLLERVGFTHEGYARAYLKIDGDWRDHLLFGLLREDFERDA